MYRLLVVDDEEKLRKAIEKYAKFQGYKVTEAANGKQAVELCGNNKYDLILMDVSMPVMDGISACRAIRRLCDTPVIMLTARGEEYDRIVGFESGADDYVAKPFSPKELMLRIAAVLKRSNPPEDEERIESLQSGGISLNLKARLAHVDGARVELTPKEFDLLSCLMRSPGEVLSRHVILNEIWGGDRTEGGDRTLDTHIKQVRKALGHYSGQIVTVRGMGYRFDEN